jgi:hypothetical protein
MVTGNDAAGPTRAAVAIVQAGTIILDGSPDQCPRAIGLAVDYVPDGQES